MRRTIRVKAKNKEEVMFKALKRFSEEFSEDIKPEEIVIKLVEENKGFLGLGRKENVYHVGLKDREVSAVEEDFLDMSKDISMDGYFKIRVHDSGVYLSVIPPEGRGETVKYQQIKNGLEVKKIVEVDWQIVQEAIHQADEEWVRIAPRKPELDQDAEAKIEISDDKLKAFLDYKPALGGKKLTYDDIMQMLNDAGVVYRIKQNKLEQVLKQGEEQKGMQIAEGKQPVPGQDGELIYHFNQEKESIGTKRDDGSIDYYDLGLITNVKPGDVLVTIKKPEPGQAGKGVTGEEILPPDPKTVELPTGKNVEKKDDETLVASINGQVVREGNKVHVLPIHTVNGNVDLSTGNIDFVGNVYVKGDVLEGFYIKADGNVEIRGHVSAADIESGGEVVIHKGFVGKDKGSIKARGDVRIKFVENGIINTEKNIIVTDAIMHSHLSAGERIEVTKKKGLLVGGISRAGKEIEANVIGSTLATATHLEVGINPEYKNKLNEIQEKIKDSQTNLMKTTKALTILERLKRQTGKLPSDKEIIYQRLINTQERIEKSIYDYKSQFEELEVKLKDIAQGRIKVNKQVYPGVKMTIGKAQFNVHDELRFSAFVEEQGEVRQIPL